MPKYGTVFQVLLQLVVALTLQHLTGNVIHKLNLMTRGGGGLLPKMAYTGRLRPNGVPFSDLKYMKG